MNSFQQLVCTALAILLALATATTAATLTGITLGMTGADDLAAFYLYDVAVNWTATAPHNDMAAISTNSSAATVMFYNYQPFEACMFAPPQASNTEWLIPLSTEGGEVVVHYDVAVNTLTIDQVHGGLQVGPWTKHEGDLQQILWLEAQQYYYGISVDQDYTIGELYLSFYADMVNELQQQYPHPIDNHTLTIPPLGSYHDYNVDKQSMAVSQTHQLFFVMAEYWDKTDAFAAALWTYDVVGMNMSEPVIYHTTTTEHFIDTLVYSEQRNALYAVVVVFPQSGGPAVQLLVDQINWVTGEVKSVTNSIPFPKAGLACLHAAIDDVSGELYVMFQSIDPSVYGYVVLVTAVNVDTGVVRTLAELSTFDTLMGVALTFDNNDSNEGKVKQPSRTKQVDKRQNLLQNPFEKLQRHKSSRVQFE